MSLGNSNYHYRGNARVKGTNVAEEWTPEMLEEYKRCFEDPVYFCETYGKIISLDEGLKNFELYPYQKKMVDLFENNRFSIILACRQSGKTSGIVAYVVHYVLFHRDKNVVILANKELTAQMIMSRIMTFLENVPFFLQPGAKEYNKTSILFENGCHVQALSTTSDSARGTSCVTDDTEVCICLLYTSPSPRDRQKSRMPSSA